MRLEQQLDTLNELGLVLDEGITIDDLLYSFPHDAYEQRPFDLILFALGIEVERPPWGRAICSRVWNFDTECITATGAYVRIVQRLLRVAGQLEHLTEISDLVELETGTAWLRYRVGETRRDWTVEVNDDWTDMLTLSYVMADIEQGGRRFYSKDNGQAMILFYLDEGTAARLNTLANNALRPVLPDGAPL